MAAQLLTEKHRAYVKRVSEDTVRRSPSTHAAAFPSTVASPRAHRAYCARDRPAAAVPPCPSTLAAR